MDTRGRRRVLPWPRYEPQSRALRGRLSFVVNDNVAWLIKCAANVRTIGSALRYKE